MLSLKPRPPLHGYEDLLHGLSGAAGTLAEAIYMPKGGGVYTMHIAAGTLAEAISVQTYCDQGREKKRPQKRS